MNEHEAQELIAWLWTCCVALSALFPAALIGAVIERRLGRDRLIAMPFEAQASLIGRHMDTINSDLHREAEKGVNNQQRLAAWRRRYERATGRKPVAEDSIFALAVRAALCPWLRKTQVINIAKAADAQLITSTAKLQATDTSTFKGHTNCTVVKFPRHKRQYMHSTLPTGPEAA